MEQKKDLKALSRTRTEANKRRHRYGGTAQPGYATRYRPCAAQAPPSRTRMRTPKTPRDATENPRKVFPPPPREYRDPRFFRPEIRDSGSTA